MRLRALALLVVAAACREATGPTSTSVGPSGGTVASDDDLLSLQIPAGAFSADQKLLVRALPAAESTKAPGAFTGLAYDIEPDGLALSTPGTVSIRAGGAKLGQVPFGEVVIARPGTAPLGDELPTMLSPAGGVASAPIDRLGIVWVRAARVARISITPPTPGVIAGRTVSLMATPLAADGRLLQRSVSWVVRSSSVAIVDATGVVQAIQKGSTWVVAQSESIQDSVLVQVSPAVARIDIVPPSLTMLTGDTARLQAVARDDQGAVVADAVVTWQASDSSAASASADGIVIAKHSGSASIVAHIQDVAATAPLSVQDVATIQQLSDSGGRPEPLTNLTGLVVVDIHVAAIASPVKAVTVLASCHGSSVAITAPAPDAGGLTHARFRTDSIDASGHTLFSNGACNLSVVVTTSQGSIRGSPPLAVTLANNAGFSADYVISGVNAPLGTPFPTSFTSIDGKVWHAGSVSLVLTAKAFDSQQAVTQVSGTFLGKTFDAASPAGDGRFTILFPNVENDGRSSAGFASPSGGSVPTITKASFADGSAAFTAVQATPLYLDNQAPQAPTRFALPTNNAAIGWIAGAYQFVAPANYASSGDGQGVGGTSVVAFAGTGGATPALPSGTATGSACAVGAIRSAPTGADALHVLADPSTVTNRSLVARAFETDRLGNVRCTDLSSGAFGVDVVPPTVVRAATATPDKTIFGYNTVSQPPIRFDVTASDGQSGLADPHIVHRFTIAFTPEVTPNFCLIGFSNGFCVGADASDTLGVVPLSDVHWMDNVYAVDRVGNQSAPLQTDVLNGNFDRPFTLWSGFPSVLTGGSTFSLTVQAKSGFGLYRVALGMDYSYSRAGMTIEVAADTLRDRWDLNFLKTWTGSLTISNFMRQLEIVDATDAPYDDSAEYTRAYGITVLAENIAGTALGDFYGLGDKNMPLGFTYFGKGIRQFRVTTPATTVSNGGASAASVGLSAAVTTDLATASPFTSVCFYYSKPSVSSGWQAAGCTSSATTTTTATTRTLEYHASLNPPPTFGTSGTVLVRAIGMNATGDGLSSNSSSAVTLVP